MLLLISITSAMWLESGGMRVYTQATIKASPAKLGQAPEPARTDSDSDSRLSTKYPLPMLASHWLGPHGPIIKLV